MNTYTLDGQSHLSEAVRVTGAEIASRSHLPDRHAFFLLLLADGPRPDILIPPDAVLTLNGKLEFVTRPLAVVAQPIRGLIAA